MPFSRVQNGFSGTHVALVLLFPKLPFLFTHHSRTWAIRLPGTSILTSLPGGILSLRVLSSSISSRQAFYPLSDGNRRCAAKGTVSCGSKPLSNHANELAVPKKHRAGVEAVPTTGAPCRQAQIVCISARQEAGVGAEGR